MHLRRIVVHTGPGAELVYKAEKGTELHIFVGDALAALDGSEGTRVKIEDPSSSWVLQDQIVSGQE